MGFIYRIFLSRTLGAENLGIYQIAISVLGLFMTITSSGIPITISRIFAKNKNDNAEYKNAEAVSAGILSVLALSIPITILILFKSEAISFVFSDKRCISALMIMIPGLIFTSVYAVIRGTFWGNTRFLTYSVIEFTEEAVMMIAGIILVNKATDALDGLEKASYAVLISYLFSFTVSAVCYFVKGGKLRSPKKALKPLIISSAPITAMKTMTSFLSTSISLILPARLVYYGATSSYALSEFGKVFGMAFPLIFMPSTLIGSLALVLVPELSDNFYSGRYITLKNNVEKAVKFSVLIACMIMPIFFSVAKPLSEFLYLDESVGTYIIRSTATMLPLSVSIISTSMLNSLNKERQTLISFLIGALALIVCILFLPSVMGIDSLIVGMFLNYGISAVINMKLLKKASPVKPNCTLYIIKLCLLVIPTTVFGTQLKSILIINFNAFITLLICIPATAAFQFALFCVFGIVKFHSKKRFKGFILDRTGKSIKSKA